MKPHIRYIVEGQILGSSLIKQGTTTDKEAQPIEPDTYYPYITTQTDNERTTVISKPSPPIR